MTLPLKKYRCPHCHHIVERRSTKAWIRSWCVKTNRNVRIQRVKET